MRLWPAASSDARPLRLHPRRSPANRHHGEIWARHWVFLCRFGLDNIWRFAQRPPYARLTRRKFRKNQPDTIPR